MRKRLIGDQSSGQLPSTPEWIDLPTVGTAEVTSEQEAYGFECAVTPGSTSEWRASVPGNQLIRLIFDHRLPLKHIHIAFHERQVQRTQEFLLRWSADHGKSFAEIVRQQYTFSPPGTTSEVEDYVVDLQGVTILELSIKPDITGRPAYASLAELRLA